MSKKKSTVCLVLITILLAVVLAMTFVSFPIPGTVKNYNSILSNVGLGTDVGGSYYTVYYPEGVLSKDEYENQYEVLAEDKKDAFADKYDQIGGLYVEHSLVGDSKKKEMSDALSVISARYEQLGIAGYTVSLYDEYSILVTLPSSTQNPDRIFELFAYDGDFSIGESAGDQGFKANRYHQTSDYYKKAVVQTRDHRSFVQIELTELGVEKVTAYAEGVISRKNSNNASQNNNSVDLSNQANASNTQIFFNVGDHNLTGMNIAECFGNGSIYLSGYENEEQAKAVASLVDSIINGKKFDTVLTVGTVYTAEATYGDSASIILLSVLGALILAMAIFFIVKYHGIAAAHLYAFAVFMLAMIILLAAIPTLFVTTSALLGVMFAAGLMVATNLSILGRIKKEFDLGKTIVASIKLGYQKALIPTVEMHVALAVFALISALIGVTELQIFSIIFGIGVVFSIACTLVLTRFFWHIMMNHAKNQYTFCNWKREGLEDEE